MLYKVTYKNTTDEAQDVTITDSIPKYTTYVDGSADNGGKYADGKIAWTKKNVAVGETFEVTFKVKVDKDVNGKPLDNKANVKDGFNDSDTNQVHNPTPTEPVKEAFKPTDTKTNIDGKAIKGGDELLYKVTYKNTTGEAQDVTITDTIPQHTKYVEGSADNGGKYADGKITWTKKNVVDGETFEVTFKVTVDKDVNGAPVENKANVKDGVNDSDTNQVHNPTPTEPVKKAFKPADTKTNIDGKAVKGGDELLYKVTYKNTTGETQDVTITDSIPKYTTYVDGSADNGGKYADGKITWTKKNVADGETFEVTFKVKVDKAVNGKPLDNKANVKDGFNDSDTNQVHNPTPTEPVKDVFVPSDTKTNIDGRIVKAGDELLYKVTYKNTTGETQDVTITDSIPKYTTYVEGSADNDGKYADGKITWTKKNVADGETFEVTFKVRVDKNVDGQTVINKANVKDGFNDSDTNAIRNKTPKIPPVTNTGDTTPLMPFLFILATASLALMLMIVFGRKRQY